MKATDSTPWATLESRGFLHIPSFFSHSDLQALISDFESTSAGSNSNHQVKFASRSALKTLADKLAPVVALIKREAHINVDRTICGVYFDTNDIARWKTPPAFHQDHEDYYLFQDLANYLNFYIPIIKENPEKSNLSFVPFDVLQKRDRKTFERLRGRGASRLQLLQSGRTKVLDDACGNSWLMNCPVDEIAITPTLHAGDVLVLRGDVIHKTQDSDTRRVAVSYRMADSNHIVKKSNLLKGSLVKLKYMTGYRNQFIKVLRCFPSMGEITVGELYSHLLTKADPVTVARFLFTLLLHKARLYVQSFSRSKPQASQ